MSDYTVVDQTPGGRIYLDPGETKEVFFKIRNDGPGTWTKGGANPVRLGTDSAQNRVCGFHKVGNLGWIPAGQPGVPAAGTRIEMEETSVGPGQTATFRFEVTGLTGSSNPAAIHPEYFSPVIEGFAWMSPRPHAHLKIDMRPISTTIFPWTTKHGFHWNSEKLAGNRTTDIPKLGGDIPDGPYSSDDPAVIARQLELMWEAGINNLSIDTGGYDSFSFACAEKIIDIMESDFPHMTFNFFMDNLDDYGQGQFDVLYGFAGHPNQRYYDTKPLLLHFGTPPSGFADSRFTFIKAGAQDSTADWHFESWPSMSPIKGACGTVIARYDDRVTVATPPSVHGKPSTQIQTKDPNLTEDMFASQFGTVYNVWNDYDNNMRIVFFNSWNEYHERISPFEPHEDRNVNGATSPAVSDTYLYDRLCQYVGEMKAN